MVTAYVLAAAASTPVWGKASDLYGRKRLIAAAIGVFVAFSALSGTAQGIGELIAFRALQGIGAGGVMTLAAASVADLVPPRERGRYQGYIQLTFLLASLAGPLLGGLFVDQLSWRWAFYVNVPIGAVALTVLWAFLPAGTQRRASRIDYAGAALLASLVVAILLIVSWGGSEYSWSSPEILALIAGAIALLIAFVVRERSAAEPVLPLRLFGDPVFTVVAAAAFVTTLSLFAAIVFLPVFLQLVTGASATGSGLLTLPLLAASAVSTILSGLIMARTGRYKIFPVIGLALMSAGLFLFSTLGATGSRLSAALFMVVFGAGFGMVTQILMVAIQNAVSPREIGTATAAANLFRALGGSVAGDRGLLYAIAAEHFLPYRIAPPRCLSASERQVERYLLPSLRRDYAQPAVCVVDVGGDDPAATPLENCAGLSGAPDAMLGTGATPLLGAAPDRVTSVTARFETSPPRTVKVRHNFYEIVAPGLATTPCGVELLDASGSGAKSVAGCDYPPAEVGPLLAYRSYVTQELSTVQSDVGVLAGAIGNGNVALAQADWLNAHMAWLDIGQDDAAYGCFGELGPEIDGTAAGLVGGTASSQFTGFHKIEFDLWTDRSLTAAGADTATLRQLLTALLAIPLGTELPATQAGVANWVLRPHEILEDALRDTLTGDDEYGSGTGLASITADVSATRVLLGLLARVLDPLAPHLVARANGQLSVVLGDVDQTEINGAWVAVGDLPSLARERVDAGVSAALETLAPIPDLLTSTGHAAPAT